MVRRVCVIWPNGEIDVVSSEDGERAAENTARDLVEFFNKGARGANELAQFGTIEVDLMSFKEMR